MYSKAATKASKGKHSSIKHNVQKHTRKARGGLCENTYASLTENCQVKSTGAGDEDGPKCPLIFQRPDSFSVIKYVEFACNGRYLACVEVKHVDKNKDPRAWQYGNPLTQLLLLQVAQNDNSNTNEATNTAPHVASNNDVELDGDFVIVASTGIDFIEVYCVAMSCDTTQIATYGFGYNDLSRKPTIYVHEIQSHGLNDVVLARKAKLVFDDSEILWAKVTTCKFLPTNDEILATSICNDYHSVRKTNFLDFWNTRSNLHIARFSIGKESPDFQGYVSSKAFSPDGLVLAMVSSTTQWQLLLYNFQATSFSKVFSKHQLGYDDPEEHFQTICEFVGEYNLLICTFHGELSRLTLNPSSPAVQSFLYTINFFEFQPQNGLLPTENEVIGFKYCQDSQRCLIKTKSKLFTVDMESCKVKMEMSFANNPDNSDSSSCIAISKTGKELAVIMNQCSIKVLSVQNKDSSLKSICRHKLITLVPEDKISHLLLPKTLKSYLLYGKQ